jgi:hypothetical protein
MRPMTTSFVAALLGAGVLMAAPAVMAQNATSQQAAPSSGISDQQLDAAAAVMQQMTDVQQDYQQKIDAAAPADKPLLKSESTAAQEKVATDNGLSIDDYNSIATAIQNDPAVRAKLMQRVH